MPHQSLKLIPGVDQNKTLALNEAAISNTNLVRFIPDRNGIGLVQKLGGWTKFFPSQIGSTVRALWAWEDLNDQSWLGVGATESLSAILGAGQLTITPRTRLSTAVNSAGFSTSAGSSTVTITDALSNVDSFDVVDIKTQVSIDGLILFGLYNVTRVSGTQFSIQARNALGGPAFATSGASGGAVPSFATTSGSSRVTVTLNSHGFFDGDSFPVLISTTVGGITLSGNYTVSSATTNTFIITASSSATSTTTISENNGNAYFVYYDGVGPQQANAGYGVGGYGSGGYGSGVVTPSLPGTAITAIDWSLDNWGETLIANPLNGPIYQWSPSENNPVATIIPEAPQVNEGCFVAMPQRQIIAYGSTFNGVKDPLLIRWCDVGDYNSWIGLVTNQAGSYRIPKGSKIVQAIQGPQQGLIWTDLGVWAMQYVGPPYVYQFNEVGTGCGLIGRRAATSVNGIVYWMGQSQFFRLAGSGVEPIRCPIWDVIFQDLDTDNLDKIRVAPNSRFGEISWFYPTRSNGGEVSHYVKYNFLIDQWDFGTLARTAWINESVLGPPIGAGPDRFIYQHETSPDADGQAINASFQTGYFALSEADVKMFIDQIWPDMKWGYYGGTQGAQVQITFYVTDYAGQTPLQYGPYTMTQSTTFITPRFRGRLVSIKVDSSDIGSFWRIGNIRYRIQPDGKY
jgi:hypothetical protein